MISALSRRLPGRLVPDFVAPAALACLLSVGLVTSARAEKPTLLDAITKSGTLRVGLTADYLPFSIAEISGKVEGIDVDMANNLAESLGVKLEIVKTSWSTLKSDLEGNKFDIAMGGNHHHTRTPEGGVVFHSRLFKRQNSDHPLRGRGQVRNPAANRSAGSARHRQSRRHQRALR